MFSREQIGTDGMVQVYDIPDKKWVRRQPVDAKEMVTTRTGSLTGPNVSMNGPAGAIVVCQEEVAQKQTDGYAVVEAEAEEVTRLQLNKKDTSEPKGDGKKADDAYNFMKHTAAELHAFAAAAKIEDHEAMNKGELAAALDESGFRPPATA